MKSAVSRGASDGAASVSDDAGDARRHRTGRILHRAPDRAPDRARGRTPRPGARSWRRWAVLVVGLAGLTAAMVALRDWLHLDTVLLLYLLAVIVVALTVGRVAALTAAVASYVLALYLFIPPRHEFHLAPSHHLVELTIFVVVAVLVGIVADAANRRRHQLADEVARYRQLAEVERVRNGLLAAVSHDLRTPLAGIKANASALKVADPDWSPDLRVELLTSIEEAADQLTEMVSNMLALRRMDTGAQSVDLGAVALYEVAARAMLPVGDHTTTLDVAEDLPLVWADPSLLERVIANLVANAHVHAPDGGPVVVRAEPVPSGVRVSVVDHGPGIAEERWEAVFAPFQRLSDHGEGIGLGLAIARGFCEAMGTTLQPSHTPGGGLTMSLELKVAP